MQIIPIAVEQASLVLAGFGRALTHDLRNGALKRTRFEKGLSKPCGPNADKAFNWHSVSMRTDQVVNR